MGVYPGESVREGVVYTKEYQRACVRLGFVCSELLYMAELYSAVFSRKDDRKHTINCDDVQASDRLQLV